MDIFRFTKSGDLYCSSVAKQNYISQNTRYYLVSSSSWQLEKFAQDLEGQSEVKAVLLFLEGCYSMPDTVVVPVCCHCSARSPYCRGEAPVPILPLAATRSAPSASLNPGPCVHAAP